MHSANKYQKGQIIINVVLTIAICTNMNMSIAQTNRSAFTLIDSSGALELEGTKNNIYCIVNKVVLKEGDIELKNSFISCSQIDFGTCSSLTLINSKVIVLNDTDLKELKFLQGKGVSTFQVKGTLTITNPVRLKDARGCKFFQGKPELSILYGMLSPDSRKISFDKSLRLTFTKKPSI